MTTLSNAEVLAKTPLHALHLELGARMVTFAGYEMPVQYPPGIIKEHLHTRAAAGLFDVSHMGQAWLVATEGDRAGDPAADSAEALERLVPGDLRSLAPGQTRYTLLLNENGGVLDDLMVTRPAGEHLRNALFLVVNAACKEADFAHIAARLAGLATLQRAGDRALLALQGPQAAAVMARFHPPAATQKFMHVAPAILLGAECLVSRSGYTGEDGYEISVPADRAEALARALLAEPEVAPIGLGARDSLRLEAGLCLYGHDLDPATTPVEAALEWTVGRRRRSEGGFPGFEVIRRQFVTGPVRRRVGLLPEGKAPAREGTPITDLEGKPIGTVTSGGFSPTLGRPIAMGYVTTAYASDGTPVRMTLRGKALPAKVTTLPFVPQRYYRG